MIVSRRNKCNIHSIQLKTTSPLTVNFLLHGNCSTLFKISSLDSRNHLFGPILTISFQLCLSLLLQFPPELHSCQKIPIKNIFSLNVTDIELIYVFCYKLIPVSMYTNDNISLMLKLSTNCTLCYYNF